MSLIDRFTSPAALRATTSPLTIASFVVVAVVAVLAGLPLPLALGAGLGVAAARVGFVGSRPRTRRRPERIDPFAVGEPWRVFVREALQARSRFAAVVAATAQGPLRDRLDAVGRGVEHAVEECWSVSRRAHHLSQVRRQIDTRAIGRRLDALGDVADQGGTAAGLRSSLEAQLDSARRVDAAIDDARARLEILDVRLTESVTRAAELTTLGDQPGLTGLAADVEGVVDEMEALRRALDEIDRAEGSSGL